MQTLLDHRNDGLRSRHRRPDHRRVAYRPQIVAAIRADEDRHLFEEIALSFRWTVNVCPTLKEADSKIDPDRAPILVYDRDFDDVDWRTVITQAVERHPGICVLLLSHVTDQYLWNEVIRHGGYDVVLKPFRREQLNRAITFASNWMEWSARERARSLRAYK
jgi:DNA-binding NtrC family response regulator